MKRFICLLVLLVPCLSRAAYVQGYLIDITGVASSPLITFDPQSTPITGGPGVVLDIVRQVRPVNGYFSNYLAGGLYTVRFGAGGNTIGIAVPADSNVYWFTNLANLATFTYPNIYGAISARVLTGAGFTVTTNNAGEWNESISLTSSVVPGESNSVSPANAEVVVTTNGPNFQLAIASTITRDTELAAATNGLAPATNAVLYDGSSPTLHVPNRQLSGNSGGLSFDWGTGQLYDGGGLFAINLATRLLQDSLGESAVDWESRTLLDSAGNVVANWSGGWTNGGTGAVGAMSITNSSGTNRLVGDVTSPGERMAYGTDANGSRAFIDPSTNVAAGGINALAFPPLLKASSGLTGIPSDGSTDCTAALNAAIAFAATNATYGKTVFLPKAPNSYYRFTPASGGIVMRNGVRLVGESRNGVVLIPNGGTWTNSFIRCAEGDDGNSGTFAKILLQSFTIQTVTPPTNLVFIDLTANRESVVRDVRILGNAEGYGQVGILFSATNRFGGGGETCFFNHVTECSFAATKIFDTAYSASGDVGINMIDNCTGGGHNIMDFHDGNPGFVLQNSYFVGDGGYDFLPTNSRPETVTVQVFGGEGFDYNTNFFVQGINVMNPNYAESRFDGIKIEPHHIFSVENYSPVLPDSFADQYVISGLSVVTNSSTSFVTATGKAVNRHYLNAVGTSGHTVTNFGSNYTAYAVLNTNRQTYINPRIECKPSWETNATHLFLARLDIDPSGNITNLVDMRVFLPAPTFRSLTLTNSDGGAATTITSSGVNTPSINTTALDSDLQELAARATTQPYTFSERVTFNGGMAPSASEGTAIDFQGTGDKVKTWSTNADFALTFSGTPVYGDSREFHFTNASASAVTIDFPQAVFDLASTNSPQSTRTNFTVPGSRVVYFRFHPSGDRIDLLTSEATGAASSGFQNPAIADLDMDGNDILDVGNYTGSGSISNYGEVVFNGLTNTPLLRVRGQDPAATNYTDLTFTNKVGTSSTTGAEIMAHSSNGVAQLTFYADRQINLTPGNGWNVEMNANTIGLGVSGKVRLTPDGDGAIKFTGESSGFDEDFTINMDDTSDQIVLSSGSGVTNFNFGTIGLEGGTFTPTNGIFMPTNTYVPSPLGTGGWLWNSNQVLYWITSAQTNVISDGR